MSNETDNGADLDLQLETRREPWRAARLHVGDCDEEGETGLCMAGNDP